LRTPILAVNFDAPEANGCGRSNHRMLYHSELILASAYCLISVESGKSSHCP